MERVEGLISIIVPNYNTKDTLIKCIKSIERQTYTHIEIIIVDDGSTDGSSQVCDLLAKEDSRVHVIHRLNGGTAAARNSGLDIAIGEYIMFVDSDDYIDSKICESLLSGIKKENALCCMCGFQFVTTQDKGKVICSNEIICCSGKDAVKKRYLENIEYMNIINPWGKLYHWSMWKNLRFTSGLYYEDLDIVPFLYMKCDQIVCIPYVGYYYFQRIGSCSRGISEDDKRFIDSLMIRKKHVEYYKKMGELELELCIMKRTLELIMRSDINGWIPPLCKSKCKKVYTDFYKKIIHTTRVNLKEKLRYSIYRYFGPKIYGICKVLLLKKWNNTKSNTDF